MRWTSLFNTLFLSLSLLFSGTQSLMLHAQVLVDPNAPSNQRPTVLVAPNGTPLINIQTPSAAGVSRNSYQQLDINSQGAILNNSRTQVQTQLGGWVQGNPWLNQNEARVILNEVNSSNPSHLNGFIEVAGQRAEVIIANPSGISVNGAGFINASSATLTTGQVIYQNNALNSLDVTGGRIVIQGNGLNNGQVDYTKLLAKAVEVNAGIWAKDLNIGVGNAVYALDGQEAATSTASTQTNTQTTPKFLLDVSELGGMYAGKIKLVATQAGVGVNNQGYIAASAGDLELSIDGKLINKGYLLAGQADDQSAQAISSGGHNIHIKSQEVINDTGTLHAQNNLNIQSQSHVANLNQGLISAQDTLSLDAKQNLVVDKDSAFLAENIHFNLGQSIQSQGFHLAEHALTITANSLDLSSSKLTAKDLNLTANQDDAKLSNSQVEAQNLSVITPAKLHTDGAVIAADSLRLQADFLNNQAGSIEQRQAKTLELNFHNGLDNRQGSLITAQDLFIDSLFIDNQQGQIVAQGALNLRSQGQLNNDEGVLFSAADLGIDAQSLSNQQGVITSEQASIKALIADALVSSGEIYAKEHIQLQARQQDHSGSIATQTGDITLLANQGLSIGGEVNAKNSLQAEAGAISLKDGLKAYADKVTLNAMAELNSEKQAQMVAYQTLSARAQNIQNAGLLVSGEASMLYAHNSLDNSGDIQSQGDLHLSAKEINNQQAASLLSEGSSVINAENNLHNLGTITTLASLQINAGNLVENQGEIQAKTQAKITSKQVSNEQKAKIVAYDLILENQNTANQGFIEAENSLTLTSQYLTNDAGAHIIGANTSRLSVGVLTNQGLLDGGINHIVAQHFYNLSTGRVYGNHLAIQAQSLVNQTGTLAAREKMDLGVTSLRNESGAYIFSEGQLNLGGGLDENLQASVSGGRVLNIGSNIESSGSMFIRSHSLENKNTIEILDPEFIYSSNEIFIEKIGTNEKINSKELKWEHWSRAGQYRYKTDAAREYSGVLGESPIPNYRECISTTIVDGADCPSGEYAPGSDYQINDPVWAYLKVPAPAAKPVAPSGAEPMEPALPTEDCSITPKPSSCVAYQASYAQYEQDKELYQQKQEAYLNQLVQWQEATDQSYEDLNLAINLYNDGFANKKIRSWTEYKVTQSIKQSQSRNERAAKILVGGNLHLAMAGELTNYASQILVGGMITGDILQIKNSAASGQQIITNDGTSQTSKSNWRGGFKRYHERNWGKINPYHNTESRTINFVEAKQKEGERFSSTATLAKAKEQQDINNGANGIQKITPSSSHPDFGNGIEIRTKAPNFTPPNASLYIQNPAPDARFLIETDPTFANYKTWLSSDYIFEQLEFNADEYQKRFADGFYEQRLIREQINQLTGQYFLNDYSDEEEQYQALMQAGVQFAKTYDLIPGVALTTEQMAHLTTDIVWLTSQSVVLNDGTVQKVLVPQLYALTQTAGAQGGAGTIAARSIQLNVQQDIQNSGNFLAKEGLDLQAKNILNEGGRLQAKSVNLKAEEDIKNIGGEIYADDSLSLKAKGNITIASTTQQNINTTENASITNTIVDRVAGIFIGKKASGELVIDAGKTLEITGAEIDNASAQTLQLKAKDDIVFGSLELQQQEHLGSGKNYKKYDEVTYQGTQVNSQGGLTLQAGNDVNLTSAQLNSASDIEINAKNINITAQVDSKQLDQQSHTKTSSRKITEKNGFIEQSASNSSLSGENIKLNATGSVAVTGSTLKATNDLNIGEVKVVQQADGSFKAVNGEGSPDNLTVNTLELTNETWHERSVEKRGMAKTLTQVAAVAGTLMFPTLAPGLDTPEMSLGESSSQRTISTTHQGSELSAGNNLVLAAKDAVHVTSGGINAGNTAMIAAKDVTFDAAVDTHITETSHKEITVKGLGASLGKDQITLGGMEKTKQTDTERTTTTTHQGTQINSGNLVVMADNDINFIASQVNVEKDAVVQAGNDINIEGRADSTTTETYSKTDTTTVTAGVKNAYVDTAFAADAVVKAGEDVKRAEKALRDAEQRVKNGTLAASALDDYKINLAAATTQLTQATLNLASSGATAAASTGTLGFYATGQAEKTTTEQRSTNTEQQYQGSNFNVGGNASFEAGNLLNIVGSGIAVQDSLTLNADRVNIRAGIEENTSHSSSQTQTASVTASTSAGGSVGANASQSQHEADSYSKTHVNSQIRAGNLNSDSKSFTLAGANVEITHDINLNTQQLTVESVQDTHHSSSQGSNQSVGVSTSGSNVSGSIGAGKNSSSEDSQWVNNTTTFIGGGEMNVTADKTTVTGAVLANATRNNDGSLTDHGNMNLVTDELIINDLQDHNKSSNQGFNANVNAGWAEGSGNQTGHLTGTSTVGVQKGGHNTEQTTYATLGGGTITKKNGEQHDLANVNRDLNNTQEITLDQQTAGLDATVTVDHRLLSEGGRNAIKKDVVDSVQHGKEIVQSVQDVLATDQSATDFFGNVHSYATERKVLAENAANSDQQEKLRGDQQAEGSAQGLQNLSDALTQVQGLEQGAQVALYDGAQLQDNTLVLDHTSVNKTQVEGAYHQNGNGIYVNIDQTDMTNSTNTVSTLVHEQTRHRLAQEGQTGSLSRDDQTTLATNHGDRAGEVWTAYSGLAGISTQGGSTQTQWNTANSQSATVQQGTNAIAQINNNDLKARQLNRNEASLMDQAKANIHNNTTLSAEQKQQAGADLNALACAAVQCAAGVSKNDPLYEQVSQLQAQGEALKAKGEDIVSSLGVYGVDVKAADSDFAYSRIDQMDDLITSNEQTVARAGQITQGVAGAAEAAGGVALSGTGLGAVIGVPLAGLGAYDMADASDKLGTPHTYQSGQNVLNSFSLDTHGGDISPTKDAAIDLGINAALTVGAAKVAKHADDIADYVGGVFKKGDVPLNVPTASDAPKVDFYVGPSGPDSTLPSTGYRYDRYLNDDGTLNKWGMNILETQEGRATYIGFEKHHTGKEARDAYQVKGPDHVDPNIPNDISWSDGRIRSEFDTLQVYENGQPQARVPNRLGDTQKGTPEPITEAYPEYGVGGAYQLHLDGKVLQYKESKVIPEK